MKTTNKEKKKSTAKKEKKAVDKFIEIRDTAEGSLFELNLVMQLGHSIVDEVIKKVKEQFPNMPFGPYKGSLSPYLVEYINEFMMEEAQEVKNLKDVEDTDILSEVVYIESFCKWLDHEKGMTICKKKIPKKKVLKKKVLKKKTLAKRTTRRSPSKGVKLSSYKPVKPVKKNVKPKK